MYYIYIFKMLPKTDLGTLKHLVLGLTYVPAIAVLIPFVVAMVFIMLATKIVANLELDV